MPAAAGSSATFRFIPTNNRKMVLKLSLGNRVIARAEGREPGFTVTFPADGVYTLVGENPAGVASDLRNVGAEEILVDWASDPAAIVSGASAAVPFPHFEGKIVFARGDAGCSTVVVRDMARNREYTASLQGDLSEPSWSPDGSRFVASAGNCNENSHSLAVFGADARFVRFITGVGNDVDPDWGSDGRIYFARGSTQGGGTLYSVKPDGTDERSLGLSGRQPALSPDGRYLAFMRKSGAVWRIAVAPTLGNGKFGRATELSLPSAASQAWMPNWTADSRRVVFDITREGFGTVVASVDAASNYLTATVLKSEWSSPLSRPSCSPSSDTCVANGDKWGDVWLVTYENGLFTVTGEVATQQRDWGADIFP
jgi:dipeptidyl aminopeptidase/acylaminoacyl peptidase